MKIVNLVFLIACLSATTIALRIKKTDRTNELPENGNYRIKHDETNYCLDAGNQSELNWAVCNDSWTQLFTVQKKLGYYHILLADDTRYLAPTEKKKGSVWTLERTQEKVHILKNGDLLKISTEDDKYCFGFNKKNNQVKVAGCSSKWTGQNLYMVEAD